MPGSSNVPLAYMPPDPDTSALERKLSATKAVLADREAELLRLKGPCTQKPRGCVLHYAHSGPCNIQAGGQSTEQKEPE